MLSSPAQWSPDLKLSVGEASATTNENMGQCLAVSGDSVHTVWWDNINGSAIYYKHSFDGGATWSAVTRLTSVPSHASFSSVACSGNFVYVAYRDSTSNGYVSTFLHSTDAGNSWSSSIPVGNFYWWPSVTAAGNNVYLSLNSVEDSSNTEVYFRRSTDNGTTWDSIIRISNSKGRSEDPSIAACNGYVHLAWFDNRTGNREIFYRRSTDNGITWEPEINISNTNGVYAYCPMVSVNGANVDVVWSGGSAISHKYSTDYGNTWSTIDSAGAKRSVYYPVITRINSQIHLVYFNFNNGIYYQHSSNNGQTWDVDTNIVTGANKKSPFVAVGGSTVHLIWTDGREGHNAIYYKKYSSNNGNSKTSITGPVSVCYNSTKSYSTTATTGHSYQWMISGATISGADNQNTVTVNFDKHNISASLTLISITDATQAKDTIIQEITVNPLPNASIDGLLTVGNNSIQTYSSLLNAGLAYSWSVTGGKISGSNNQNSVTIIWDSVQTSGKISLTETITSTGCSSSAALNIVITKKPNPSISGSDVVCPNIIENYSTPNTPGNLYKWTIIGGVIAGDDSKSTVSVNWNVKNYFGKLFVTETNPIGGLKDSTYTAVIINTNPVVTISGNINSCVNNVETYTSIADSGEIIKWTVKNGQIIGPDNQIECQVKWPSAGSGKISQLLITNSSGCKDSSDIAISINPIPMPLINGPVIALQSSTKHYSVKSNINSQYKWFVQGGKFQNADNLPEVDIVWGEVIIGKVTAIETSKDGCTDSNSITVNLTPVSVHESNNANNSLNIYPNPVPQNTIIEFKIAKDCMASLELFDLQGREIAILYNEFTNSEINNKIPFDAAKLEPGIYFIKFNTGYYTESKRFVVIK